MLAALSASFSFAPAEVPLRPAVSRAVAMRAELAMQEVGGKPSIVSAGEGAWPVPTALKDELGALGPLGYWDPLGFSVKNPDKFTRWRATELKHGRIAMAATTGYIVQSFFRFPGYLSKSADIKFADLPNGLLAFKAIPPAGLFQIFLFIGLMERVTWNFLPDGEVPKDKLPGDVADHLWVRYTDPEEKKYKLNIEIQNGRAAMMGITGMLMHDHLTGSWIPPGF